MNELTVAGELLTASQEDRTLSFRLLPYGEPGFTSLGKVTASKGSLTIPEVGTLELNEEHDFKAPIGKFVSVTETETGLEAVVKIVATSRGNDALTLATEGLRKGISVEISEPVIRDGKLIAGNLTGAGLVVRLAFKNALLVAEDFGGIEETTTQKEVPMDNENEEVLEASDTTVQPAPLFASGDKKVDLVATTFDAFRSGTALTAALADLTQANDNGKVYIADQEVGELWQAKARVDRPIINAFGVKPLTGLTVSGTRRTRSFTVADWAGKKTDIPSAATVSSTREYVNAKGKAGAIDIGMELVSFGTPDIISELYVEGLDDYNRQTEAEVTTSVLTAATKQTAAFDDVLQVVNHAAQAFAGAGANMDVLLVSPSVYAGLVSLSADRAPWWFTNQARLDLAGTGFNGSGVNFAVSTALTGGSVLVADKRAVSYWESKDFRYQALDVPRGGVDISLIKFNALLVNDPAVVFHYTNVGLEINAPAAPAA